MIIRHAHYSLLGSTRPGLLLAVLRALLVAFRGVDVLTFTEVGNARRAAVLRLLPGFARAWIPGPTGEGECALLYARWKWRKVTATTSQLSDLGVPRRGGLRVHSLDVVLEGRRTGERHMFSVAHLPSGIEGDLISGRAGAQVDVWRDAARAWARRAAVWRNTFAGVHLAADWNACYRRHPVRVRLADMFPGFVATWAGRDPARGTHERRLIDFTLTTYAVTRARVGIRRRASDHKPYREVLRPRRTR